MPGYKTHLAGSATVGVLFGAGTWYAEAASPISSVMGATLCCLGGLIPDIDSKTSESFRKCLALVAGFSSLMLVSRLRDYRLEPESVALIGGGVFVLIWFGVGRLVQKLTVHRGMCHSIPMAVLCAEVIFLLSSGGIPDRLYNALAIGLGVMVHLVLDEYYSFEMDRQKKIPGVHVKKSFGSALKLIDFDNIKASAVMFILLGLTTKIAINEPDWSATWDRIDSMVPARVVGDTNAKKEIDRIRIAHPDSFDLTAMEWVAENDLTLQPRTGDNPKWADLTRLLNVAPAAQKSHKKTEISP